jgi:flagellar biosynthesis anti-sigma factor FlgM
MDGIDKAAGASVVPFRPISAGAQPTASVVPVSAKTPSASEVADLISLLGDAAPPIDTKKVEAIKALIASNSYPIDEHAIAAKMLALDFRERGDRADA